jgi:hypothetical protein
MPAKGLFKDTTSCETGGLIVIPGPVFGIPGIGSAEDDFLIDLNSGTNSCLLSLIISSISFF